MTATATLPPPGWGVPRSRAAALGGRLALARRAPALVPLLAARGAVEALVRRASPIGATPFFPPDAAPVAELVARWTAIRDELAPLLRERVTRVPPFATLQPEQARIADAGWRTWVLWAFGERVERGCAPCPETAAMLDRVPGLVSAMFSILEPGQRVPPHRGVYSGLLRVHLGLVVPGPPGAARIRVGDEVRSWAEGKLLVFDDSFEHEVWNGAPGPRAILFLDLLRPLPAPLAGLNAAAVRAIGRTRFARRGVENLERWLDGLDG